jgi:hypothetical protein
LRHFHQRNLTCSESTTTGYCNSDASPTNKFHSMRFTTRAIQEHLIKNPLDRTLLNSTSQNPQANRIPQPDKPPAR